MIDYELAILYHPDLEVDLSKAEERVSRIISDSGGKIKKTDNWGKRKLAYDVLGNSHAIYVFYLVELEPGKLTDIERALNIASEIIRWLITKVDYRAIEKADKLKEIIAARVPKEATDEATEDEA